MTDTFTCFLAKYLDSCLHWVISILTFPHANRGSESANSHSPTFFTPFKKCHKCVQFVKHGTCGLYLTSNVWTGVPRPSTSLDTNFRRHRFTHHKTLITYTMHQFNQQKTSITYSKHQFTHHKTLITYTMHQFNQQKTSITYSRHQFNHLKTSITYARHQFTHQKTSRTYTRH